MARSKVARSLTTPRRDGTRTPLPTAAKKIPSRALSPEERAARTAWMLKAAKEMRGY